MGTDVADAQEEDPSHLGEGGEVGGRDGIHLKGHLKEASNSEYPPAN